MPFVRLTIHGPALSDEQVQRLQRGTTELMVSGLRKPLEGTAVLVEQSHQGSWSIAGRPTAVAAQVDTIICLGSNSSAEKAMFMAEMMTLLRSVLGAGLPDETYIAIHEIAPDTYGRGGLTRAERDRQRHIEGMGR
jgi:4-oxalocrotonate tautomerase